MVVYMSVSYTGGGSTSQPYEHYKLVQTGDHLAFQEISENDPHEYSPLDTLKSVEENLEKLSTINNTLQVVEKILHVYKNELKEIASSRAVEDITKEENEAIALCQRIKDKWAKIHAIPDPYSGTAIVHASQEQNEMQIEIRISEGTYGRKLFQAFNKNGQRIGHMGIDWLRTLDNGIYGSKNHTFGLEPYYSDGFYQNNTTNERFNVIYIETIKTSFSDYKGVGTALIQAAMEYSYLKGCEGRLVTNTVNDAAPFYFKLGMRCQDAYRNNYIKTYITTAAEKGRTGHNFGSHYMSMTPVNIMQWKEKIREHPVFAATAQYLGSKGMGEEEIFQLFSKQERKKDSDILDDLLILTKWMSDSSDIDPKKVFGFLELFPIGERVAAAGALLRLASENWGEVTPTDERHPFLKLNEDVEKQPFQARLEFIQNLVPKGDEGS